ncbi:MAG: hypothetical protein PVH37_08605 [Desulfobacterales bacterium]|jgi:plasmid maintenance system antidote protein VapI
MGIIKNEDPAAGSTGLRALTAFKIQLEDMKIRLNKEIGNYPSPIPACDVQFNYLLDERSKNSMRLKQVENLLRICQTKTIAIETIEELIKMSSQIDDDMAARLRAAFSRTDRDKKSTGSKDQN